MKTAPPGPRLRLRVCDCECVYMHNLVRLQLQFDYATQSDNCNCPSIHAIEKIELLAEACHSPVHQVALYPFQLVVIESHLRLTSLRHQLPRHSRKMAFEERDKATSFFISYMVYMIIAETRCTIALLLAVILEESRRRRPSTSGLRPW